MISLADTWISCIAFPEVIDHFIGSPDPLFA